MSNIRVILWLVFLVACESGEKDHVYKYTKFAMDTLVEYTIIATSDSAAIGAMQKAHAEILRIDSLLWEENRGSQIYKFNSSESGVQLDEETANFLKRAARYHQISNGAFDISIKPVLDLYDFKADNPSPPSDKDIDAMLQFVGIDKIKFGDDSELEKAQPEVSVAVGGVAKGYAADRAIQILKENGIRNALVNAGGDLYCLGTKHGEPWAVGVQDPDNANAIIEILYLSDIAAATSGDYQRYFIHEGQRYHHILNPKNGKPALGSRSATVIAKSTEEADALATALFILGKNEGIALIDRLANIEGMVIDEEGRDYQSQGYEKFAMKNRRVE